MGLNIHRNLTRFIWDWSWGGRGERGVGMGIEVVVGLCVQMAGQVRRPTKRHQRRAYQYCCVLLRFSNSKANNEIFLHKHPL